MWRPAYTLTTLLLLSACGSATPPTPESPPAAKQGRKAKKRPAKQNPAVPGKGSFWDFEEDWQTTTTGDAGTAPEEAPNIVLVIGCTVRRDQITPYGGHPDATPFLSTFARAGARFEDAIAAAPWTKAASTALLTGHHAVSVGMVEPGPKRNHKILPEQVPTLAQRLHRKGWQTIGSTANPNLNTTFGLARGFERWHDSLGAVHQDHRAGIDIVNEVLEKVDARDTSRPLMVQLMLTDTHTPRRPAPEHKAIFQNTEPAKLAGYRAAMHQFDAAVETLAKGLGERGINGTNTYFILIADHGEGLGTPAHHRDAHGMTLYPSVVRIPWMVRGPGIAENHVITGVASGVDLLPTVLSLLSLPFEDTLPGKDFSAQLRGESSTTNRQVAWSDSWFHETNRSSLWTPSTQCQLDFGSQPSKRDTHVDGCFDRKADPDFTKPSENADLYEQLRAWRNARTAELDTTGPGKEAQLDEATVNQLRALGYAD